MVSAEKYLGTYVNSMVLRIPLMIAFFKRKSELDRGLIDAIERKGDYSDIVKDIKCIIGKDTTFRKKDGETLRYLVNRMNRSLNRLSNYLRIEIKIEGLEEFDQFGLKLKKPAEHIDNFLVVSEVATAKLLGVLKEQYDHIKKNDIIGYQNTFSDQNLYLQRLTSYGDSTVNQLERILYNVQHFLEEHTGDRSMMKLSKVVFYFSLVSLIAAFAVGHEPAKIVSGITTIGSHFLKNHYKNLPDADAKKLMGLIRETTFN